MQRTPQPCYSSMTFIVDQLFPPLKPDETETIEYSSFNYWRDPIPELSLQLPELDVEKTSTNTSINKELKQQLSTIPEN